MATASPPGPSMTGSPGHVLRVLVLPVACAGAALLISAFVGHVQVGLLLAAGVALGAVNGLLMESATAKMTPEAAPERSAIVKSSLGRLGLVTVVALVIVYLARPRGWVLLLGLAAYQILSLAATLGTAAKEARTG